MERGNANYIVDIGLGVTFILVFFTGVLKFPGLVNKLGFAYSDFPWNVINKIHDFSGIAMGLFALMHVLLHWKWIVEYTKKIFGAKKSEESNGENKN